MEHTLHRVVRFGEARDTPGLNPEGTPACCKMPAMQVCACGVFRMTSRSSTYVSKVQ
eukprot:COSAG02_NODE_728_length_17995_cov_52.042244_14_plen_57_part_00